MAGFAASPQPDLSAKVVVVSTAFFRIGDFVGRVAIQICPEKRVRLGQREVKFRQALSAQA